MKYIFIVLSFFILFACAQDSPNIQQIGNLQFFIDNNKNNNVIELEPGLQYSIIKQGDPSGPTPEISETITAHFHGTLTNGEVFYSTLETDPLEMKLSGLILGCQKTISLMRKGDKWKIFIDPTMAYGEQIKPGIPSNSILIFEIELLDIS